MNEIPLLEKWIYLTLSSDSEIVRAIEKRVFAYIAPQAAIYPLVIFNLQASSDVQGAGVERIQTRAIYTIKTVSLGNPDASTRTVLDRIDALIGRAVHAPLDGLLFSARRTQTLRYVEAVGDIRYHHHGGMYEIFCYPEA
ncbi:MAG: hypothetical protein K1Y36_10320 [Blastocatellia bacterium]|nr:hypothetical protein [Blastocatellia bacterium]HMW02615.1 hypothetical protein [Acidobacteriota bacterium]